MKKIVLIIISILISFNIYSLNVPRLTGPVVDNAGVLSSSEETEISNYIKAVERSSGAQIAVLVIDSLEGESLEMFSYKTAKEWALGEESNDNGVLLLVSINDRKMRIEVGHGLEGILTDATSGYIIRNIITPSFKSGDFAQGIMDGVKAMGDLIAGDVSPSQYSDSARSGRSSAGSYFGIIFFLIFLVIRISMMGRRRRGFFFWGLGGHHHHHHHSSRSSSFSSGGFSSGSSFSGGGGSFGGGGASGGW